MLGLAVDQLAVVEIVDFHGALHVVECLRGHLPGCLRTGAENLVDLFDAAFVVFAAFAERLQRLVEHSDQEFLDLHVAQAAAAVMRLQLVQRRFRRGKGIAYFYSEEVVGRLPMVYIMRYNTGQPDAQSVFKCYDGRFLNSAYALNIFLPRRLKIVYS